MGRLLRFFAAVEDGILVLLLSVMIGLAGYQIFARNLFDSGLSWADPLLRVLVLWVGLLGAMAATRDDNHITIDVLSRFLSDRHNAAVRVAVDLFTSCIAAFLTYQSVRLVIDEKDFGTVAFASVPTWICQLILPFAFGTIALRYLIYLLAHIRQAATGRTPS